jgi:membrane-associated protein
MEHILFWMTNPALVLETVGPWSMAVLMLLAFLTGTVIPGFFIPGTPLLLAAGVLISRGDIPVDIRVAACALAFQVFLGSLFGYLLGSVLGERARPASRWLTPQRAEHAAAMMSTHAGRAVAVAPFIPFVRNLVPVAAGIANMPVRTYATFSAVGALSWGGGIPVIGYLFGSVPGVGHRLNILLPALFVLMLAPSIYRRVRNRTHSTDTSTTDTSTTDTSTTDTSEATGQY